MLQELTECQTLFEDAVVIVRDCAATNRQWMSRAAVPIAQGPAA
jgi:hypothetical protein